MTAWTVTGTITPLQSKVDLKLQLGNLTTHHTFYLADITDECILSMDYLKPVEAVLDLGEGLMTIGGEKIPLTGAKKDVESVCRRVVAAVTTTPPPQTLKQLFQSTRENLEARMGTATLQ